MQIFVKLYGDLKKYAPGDQPHFTLTLDPGATLEDIHRMLAIPKGQHVSLINGLRCSTDATVADGDTLVLLPPISGGWSFILSSNRANRNIWLTRVSAS